MLGVTLAAIAVLLSARYPMPTTLIFDWHGIWIAAGAVAIGLAATMARTVVARDLPESEVPRHLLISIILSKLAVLVAVLLLLVGAAIGYLTPYRQLTFDSVITMLVAGGLLMVLLNAALAIVRMIAALSPPPAD